MERKYDYVDDWLHEVALIAEALPRDYIAQMAEALAKVRTNEGRVFVLGLGGSAANASHAVNDLRRIAGIEAYAPSDNMAEFSALANDLGWESTFDKYLAESHLCQRDAILVLSVNGGSTTISPNLVTATNYARERQALVLAIVGRKTGYVAQYANVFVAIPCPSDSRRTPHAESFQGIIWHCLCHMLREDSMNAAVAATPAGVPTL